MAKKVTIEFYLIDSFEIFHYLPIYEGLKSQGFDVHIVAEPPEINTAKSWFDNEDAVKILNDLNVPFKTQCNPDSEIAITTQDAHLLKKYKNKKVNMSYGFGFNKDSYGISKRTCEGFDYRWVHGEYQKKHLSKYMNESKIKIIGHPKLISLMKNSITKEQIKRKLNIQTDKPILTYFPTWDEDTSVHLFGDEINELKDKYFVVTKAHHCTFRMPDKKKDLQKIYEISNLVLEGNSSFTEASMLGDFILCDAKSGSGLDVKFLNPNSPMLLLTVRENIQNDFAPEFASISKIINNPKVLAENISITKQFNTKIDINYFIENNPEYIEVIKDCCTQKLCK